MRLSSAPASASCACTTSRLSATPGREPVAALLELLTGERDAVLRHAHALLGRLQVEQHGLHLVVDARAQVVEARARLARAGLGLAHAGRHAAALEHRHAHAAGHRVRGERAGDGVADGPVVGAHPDRREALAARGLARLLGGLDARGRGLEVGAVAHRARGGLLGGDRRRRHERHRVGQAEALPEREADGAGERQLLLGRVLLGHDQPLPLRLRLHVGPQDLDAGAEARRAPVAREAEEGLRGLELRASGGDPRLAGHGLEVELAAGEHHEVAGARLVLPRRLERVGRGVPAVQRVQVEDRLLDVGTRVEDVERADERRLSGDREAERLEVDLLARLRNRPAHLRQQVGGGGAARGLGGVHGHGAQDRPEVRAQPALDRVAQRERDLVGRGLAGRHAARERAEAPRTRRRSRARRRAARRRGASRRRSPGRPRARRPTAGPTRPGPSRGGRRAPPGGCFCRLGACWRRVPVRSVRERMR